MFSQKVLARLILGSFAALALANPALAQPGGDAVEIGGGVPSGQAWFDVRDVKSSRTQAVSLATSGQVRSVQSGTDSSILSVTSPVDFLAEDHGDGVGIVEFELSEAVSLDGVSFVAFDAFNLDITASDTYGVVVWWQLLYQGQQLMDQSLAGIVEEGGSGAQTLKVVVRGAQFLSEMDPGTMADGVRLIFDYTGAETIFTTALSSINKDNALNWRFASCAFSLQGPHRSLLLHHDIDTDDCLAPITWGAEGQTGASPWQVREFDEPVSMNDLRYVVAGKFYFEYLATEGRGTVELQLLVSDGSVRTLDDWNSPSMREPPDFNLLIGILSLFLDDAPQDLWITGFQWRVDLESAESALEVTPFDPFHFVFLYDVPVCSTCPGCSSCFSDLNGDGEVGPFDLALLLGNWGACTSCSDCFADLNGSGTVGASDLAILLGNWGACP